MNIDEHTTIPYLGDLQRTDARPGDVFVITCQRPLSADQIAKIHDVWRYQMGDGVRMIVLCGGLELTLFNVQAAMENQQPGTGVEP